MRTEIAGDVERIDEELAVLDADMHVRAEDQKLLCEIREILLHAHIAFQRRDLLLHPPRERVRAGRHDFEPFPRGKAHDESAQPHQLSAKLGRSLTDFAPNLDHALMQLGLHFTEPHVILLEDLRDVRAKLPRHGVDDLILFLDTEAE